MSDIDLPAKGRSIFWRKRGETKWREGVVDFCWFGIEHAIKLRDGTDVFPALGEEWKYAREIVP